MCRGAFTNLILTVAGSHDYPHKWMRNGIQKSQLQFLRDLFYFLGKEKCIVEVLWNMNSESHTKGVSCSGSPPSYLPQFPHAAVRA